jgi:hypothetical protein
MIATFFQLFSTAFLGLAWYNESYRHDQASAVINLLWCIVMLLTAIFNRMDEK